MWGSCHVCLIVMSFTSHSYQGRKKLFSKGGAILGADPGICKGASVCGKKVYNLLHAGIHLHPPSAFEGGANFSLSSICTPPWLLKGVRIFPYEPPKNLFGLVGAILVKKALKKVQNLHFYTPSATRTLEFFQRVFKGGCDRTDAPPLPTPLYIYYFVRIGH